MCTSIAAGREATQDNVTLFARNEDCERNNWNKYMVFRKHPEYHDSKNNITIDGKIWTLGNGLQVPIPQNEFSYSAIPDAIGYQEANYAIGKRYFFEERGINECNVGISATNSMSTRASESPTNSDGTPNKRYDNMCKKMQELNGYVDIGIEEAIITTLILPQAESARHGVELLGHYVETYGASEGNGILFGDIDEVWYMEIGSKQHWIAVKIPDDKYIAVANGLRIHGVNLDDNNVLHSKEIFEFVKDNGFLQNPKNENFNFAEAFGILGDPYNDDRVWLAQKILTPSKVQEPPKIQNRQEVKPPQTTEQYPLFLKADKKIKPQDVMKVLRANYKGTSIADSAERPIGVYRTGESHIVILDKSMPEPLQGIIWQVISTPLGAPYIPIFNNLEEYPVSYAQGNGKFSSASAFWSFRGLFAMGECEEIHQEKIQKFWIGYEDQFLDEHQYICSTIKQMYEVSEQVAIDFAKRYSSGILYEAIGKANKKRDAIMTEITLEQGYPPMNKKYCYQ